MSLSVSTEERKNNSWTIVLDGRLDGETAGQCDKAVAAVLEKKPSSIVFDMEKLDYISSAGLRVIMTARKEMEAQEGRVVTAKMQSPVAKVFEMASILQQTDIFDSVESADIYLDAIQRRESMKNFDMPDE